MITATAPKHPASNLVAGGSLVRTSHIILRGQLVYNPTATGQGTTPINNVSPAHVVGPAITNEGLNVYTKNARGNV